MKTTFIKTAVTGVTFCLAVVGASARGSHAGGHMSTHSAMSTHSSMGSTHMNSHATTRSNAGGATTGLTRARDAQTLNTKADDERGFTTAPGLDKAAKAKAKAKSDTDLDADDKTTDTDKKKTTDTDKKKSTARSNAGGTTRGLARAKQVQALNTTANANRGFTSPTGLSTATTSTTKTKKSPKTKPAKSSGADDESRD